MINVYALLVSREASPLRFVNSSGPPSNPKPETYYVSEGTYQSKRLSLVKMESTILRTLGFDTHVAIPHPIALTYLQTLGSSTPAVAQRTLEHLNAALLSPQLLYVTHQPNALAVAAIYLAARETGVKLVECEWWEVFDVDREELGFLVVALRSMDGFAQAQEDEWKDRVLPLTVADVQREVERRKLLEEAG